MITVSGMNILVTTFQVHLIRPEEMEMKNLCVHTYACVYRAKLWLKISHSCAKHLSICFVCCFRILFFLQGECNFHKIAGTSFKNGPIVALQIGPIMLCNILGPLS